MMGMQASAEPAENKMALTAKHFAYCAIF